MGFFPFSRNWQISDQEKFGGQQWGVGSVGSGFRIFGAPFQTSQNRRKPKRNGGNGDGTKNVTTVCDKRHDNLRHFTTICDIL